MVLSLTFPILQVQMLWTIIFDTTRLICSILSLSRLGVLTCLIQVKCQNQNTITEFNPSGQILLCKFSLDFESWGILEKCILLSWDICKTHGLEFSHPLNIWSCCSLIPLSTKERFHSSPIGSSSSLAGHHNCSWSDNALLLCMVASPEALVATLVR